MSGRSWIAAGGIAVGLLGLQAALERAETHDAVSVVPVAEADAADGGSSSASTQAVADAASGSSDPLRMAEMKLERASELATQSSPEMQDRLAPVIDELDFEVASLRESVERGETVVGLESTMLRIDRDLTSLLRMLQ